MKPLHQLFWRGIVTAILLSLISQRWLFLPPWKDWRLCSPFGQLAGVQHPFIVPFWCHHSWYGYGIPCQSGIQSIWFLKEIVGVFDIIKLNTIFLDKSSMKICVCLKVIDIFLLVNWRWSVWNNSLWPRRMLLYSLWVATMVMHFSGGNWLSFSLCERKQWVHPLAVGQNLVEPCWHQWRCERVKKFLQYQYSLEEEKGLILLFFSVQISLSEVRAVRN